MQKEKMIWVQRLMYNSKHKYCTTAIPFLIPALFLLSPYFIIRKPFMNCSVLKLLALLLGTLWGYFGPLLIDVYTKSLDAFFFSCDRLFIKPNQGMELRTKTNRIFQLSSYFFSISWIGAFLYTIFAYPAFWSQFSFYGFRDIFFIFFLGCLIILLHLTAIGFAGAFTSLWLGYYIIRRQMVTISLESISSNFGFDAFKILAYKTTLLFSSGICFVPFLVVFSQESIPNIRPIIDCSFILFTCFLITSFVLPTKYAYHYAKKLLMKEYTKVYIEYLSCLNGCLGSSSNVKDELRSMNLYNYLSLLINKDLLKTDEMTNFKVLITSVLPLFGIILDMNNFINFAGSFFK